MTVQEVRALRTMVKEVNSKYQAIKWEKNRQMLEEMKAKPNHPFTVSDLMNATGMSRQYVVANHPGSSIDITTTKYYVECDAQGNPIGEVRAQTRKHRAYVINRKY